MNKQKVYNRIRKHLLTQGRKAGYLEGSASDGTEEFICQYRTYDPNAKRVLKCAIGCLIPFRNYDSIIEGQGVHFPAVLDVIPPSLNVTSKEDKEFLAYLQSIHDYTDVEGWRRALNSFAAEHGLDVQA